MALKAGCNYIITTTQKAVKYKVFSIPSMKSIGGALSNEML
jgi:hypothetical protein